jgi:hypothetical protein
MDEIDLLQVDRNGRLYWDGMPVEVKAAGSLAGKPWARSSSAPSSRLEASAHSLKDWRRITAGRAGWDDGRNAGSASNPAADWNNCSKGLGRGTRSNLLNLKRSIQEQFRAFRL